MERRGSLSSCTDTETEPKGVGVPERRPRSSRVSGAQKQKPNSSNLALKTAVAVSSPQLDPPTKENRSLYCTPEASPHQQRIQAQIALLALLLRLHFF